jgi:hypothetical protein
MVMNIGYGFPASPRQLSRFHQALFVWPAAVPGVAVRPEQEGAPLPFPASDALCRRGDLSQTTRM